MTPRRSLRQLYLGGWSTAVVFLGMVAFVTFVYVLVVLGGGVLIGHTAAPSVPLSVLATTVVALAFQRIQGVLEHVTTRWGLRVATPYDVLSHFADGVTGAGSSDTMPARMAMLLAEGTGAEWAQVWLNVSDRATLAASWPSDIDTDPTPPSLRNEKIGVISAGLRALPVRHGGQHLGVLRLQERAGLPLTLVEERLFAGLAAQAGLVLKRVALRAELDDRREELLVRSAEISASRERLIETQDTERSRLERDLHDGAQQHLVALTVNLRLADTIFERSPHRAAALLTQQANAAETAIETLSTLSRGIYPRQLADEGLGSALRAGIAGSTIPVRIEGRELGRFPAPVEAALYFTCMEALQNAAKHSTATSVVVRVEMSPNQWQLTITDNGIGFDQRDATVASGAGLANMRDRMDAIGGALQVVSSRGIGTTVTAVVTRSDEASAVPRTAQLTRLEV